MRRLRHSRRPTFPLSPQARRAWSWFLPEDFDKRTLENQKEIVSWLERVLAGGATEYRRFAAAKGRNPFGLHFDEKHGDSNDDIKGPRKTSLSKAPEKLAAEMRSLVEFKTSTLPAIGMSRSSIWSDETVKQKMQHYALLFGALSAEPDSPNKGLGVDAQALSFGLLVFPRVWDWYLHWRESRRGFYTTWECDLLQGTVALARRKTGWLRQDPDLAWSLAPIPGLISRTEIWRAKINWDKCCDGFLEYAGRTLVDLRRISRVHRDPFEAILPILEADEPLMEYRKIAEEIMSLSVRRAGNAIAAAEGVRSYLMIRLGLHIGARQKNMRQLLFSHKDEAGRSISALASLQRGELRWSAKACAWEVVIPCNAFKNSRSSYFSGRPYAMTLPDFSGLNTLIEEYLALHRRALLGPAPDPGTFFVKTCASAEVAAEYNDRAFYEAWRRTIQRYGIFNPYTGRGAIKGLLPHGPHSIRDVLATHVLKTTGSYEQAGFAIQDTPETIAKHYARFLPNDKAAVVARTLNRAWET